MADQQAGNKARIPRGRGRPAQVPAQVPAPVPAARAPGPAGRAGRGAAPAARPPAPAARPPAPQVAAAGGNGNGRPPIGRSTRGPGGDIVARTASMNIGGNGNGNGSTSASGSNGNGKDTKPVGRGAVRPSGAAGLVDRGKVLVTRPQDMGPKQGSAGQVEEVLSNYFELKTKNTKWSLCKHHVDIKPEEDRTFVKKKLMGQHRDKFLGYLFDGSTLFTFQNACPDGKPRTYVSRDQPREGEGKDFTLTVKFVGTVEKSDHQYLQIFNIIMKECQHHLNLQLIKRNYFDPESKIDVPEYKLQLWPGYITSVVQAENSIMLQVEITYKVLRGDTAYDVFMKCYDESRRTGGNLQTLYNTAMIGSVVMTTYNSKTYRVDEVDFNANPNSTFPQTRRGETTNIKYAQYFKDKYDKTIKDLNQPMLISRSNARDKRAGMPELVYLAPELCVMTGLNDSMRADFRLMKAVSQHTCVDPGSRMQRLQRFNQRLNGLPAVAEKLRSWGLELDRNLVRIPGRILPSERIFVADGRSYDAGRDANWDRNLRSNKMLHSVDLTNWIIVFPNKSTNETKQFCMTLQKVAAGMHYKIDLPKLYEVHSDRASDYVNTLDRAINEKNPQLVMCVVPNNRGDRYAAIKKKCIVDSPVPSQVILFKTMNNKGVMSIATKVAIQMNCKVGGAPWAVEIPLQGLMTIGYDVCHDPSDKKRSYAAMVATLDRQCIRWYSNVTRHSAGEEVSINFAVNVQKAIKRYKEVNNGDIPNVILVFRDGVGEGQIEHVLEQEVDQIKKALVEDYAAAKKPVRLCFVIVTKRINTRLFMRNSNPPPGTVVDDVITDPFRFDFYLVSQSVRQGTVAPTHYNCIENSAGLKSDHVQRLAYKFTHMYYNWSGTVRVPAPCQYAHKLAFLTSQSVGASHTHLERLLYFL